MFVSALPPQPFPLSYSRENDLNALYSRVYDEPFYATVAKKTRPPTGLLEMRYGGPAIAHWAAATIQRAFRAYRNRRRAAGRRRLAPIDLLILRAAGLAPATRAPGGLRRAASWRAPRGPAAGEDPDLAPPPPCPPLRGAPFYAPEAEPVYASRPPGERPAPPRRTVSFLHRATLPRKVAHLEVADAPAPGHARTASVPTSVATLPRHVRTFSGPARPSRPVASPSPPPPPAPADPDDVFASDGSRSASPLPPPPYIPPPSPVAFRRGPLPPPPDLAKPRVPSDGGSTASSLDSGFRSSCGGGPAASPPNAFRAGSPTSLEEGVFEPRPSPSATPRERARGFVSPPVRNASPAAPRIKKVVRIRTPEGEAFSALPDDAARRRDYRVGLGLFNRDPERGLAYLAQKQFVDATPSAVARFLRGRKGLSKAKVGAYLCDLRRPFNLAALRRFVFDLDFAGLHLDIALRQLQQEVTMPGEAQKIEKMVEVFAERYVACNQMFASGFRSPDTVFVLSYAVVLLHTDLHARAVRPGRRMKRDDFVANLRGADGGADLDEDMLRGIFDRIKAQAFRPGADHVAQVAKVEEAIVGRKRELGTLAEPDRRLVCFCRLAEVPDLCRAAKRDGAHQRGVFLFNDLLVVCKTLAKRKTAHQFRFALPVRDLRVNAFSTARYAHGIQLQDRATGKVAATFNARSEADRARFVCDLQESVAETAALDEADALFRETETLC